VWALRTRAGPDDPLAWDGCPDVLQGDAPAAVDTHMMRTQNPNTGIVPAAPSAQAVRRARTAAVVAEPRLQLGFDRRSGEYCLAVL